MINGTTEDVIICSRDCPYQIKRDDTSGGFMGHEADITNYFCGFEWPKEKYVCSVELKKEANCLCIKGLTNIPPRIGGPITEEAIRARDANRTLDALDLAAGIPISI